MGRAFLLVLSCLWTAAAAGQDAHPIQQDLQGLGRNLDRERRVLKRLQRESSSLLATLGEIDQEAADAERELESARARMARLESDLAELRSRRARAARDERALGLRLRGRLRRLYKMGELGWARVLFSSESIADGIQRASMLRHLARGDRGLIEDTRRCREQLVLGERQIGEQKKKLQQVARQVEQRQKRAEAARQEQLEALRLLSRKKALHLRAMRELKRSRQRLGRLMAAIGGKATSGKGIASWKGRLPAPVAGRVEVGFGRQVDARFGTVTLHKGVDIRAPKGREVRAVYPGSVVYADAFQGYGLLIILQHGGGYYTLYGHLDRILARKGAAVRQGDVLGAVGETGSLKGPYLYFEVRQGGKAVDPEHWVRLR